MKSIRYSSAIFLMLIGHTAFPQNKQKDTRINCVAQWKKGEEKIYLITRNKSKIESGKTLPSEDFLVETKMTVLDSSAAGYTISWVYGIPPELKKNEPIYYAVKMLEGMKFVYKTNEAGSFTELVNWEEVRDFYLQMIELQLQGRKDSTTRKILDQTLALFKTREAVESTMIKEIQLFHTPYGVSFSTKDTSAKTEVSIPITNTAMPAIQQWRIAAINADEDNFKLVITQRIDSIDRQKTIDSIVKKMGLPDKQNMDKVKNELSSFKINDYSEYSFVLATGWLKGYTVTRTMKAGELGQIETYAIKLRE
jgi:hypothetical protein